jgi:RimJ/RimL family protein N-acetyltransferase
MKAGSVFRKLRAKNGRTVILRAPKWDDLDDMLECINSLVEEGADIMMDQKQTREQEVDWLARCLSEIEKGEKAYVTAEVEGKLVGTSHVNRVNAGRQSHVGQLGIVIRDGYRNIGIGTEMMRVLIEESRRMGLKVLTLNVFATNKHAQHVYEKVGFKEVGRIPKGLVKNGTYIDETFMALEL